MRGSFNAAHAARYPARQGVGSYAVPWTMKTAKALGLTIPPSLLARADQVIE